MCSEAIRVSLLVNIKVLSNWTSSLNSLIFAIKTMFYNAFTYPFNRFYNKARIISLWCYWKMVPPKLWRKKMIWKMLIGMGFFSFSCFIFVFFVCVGVREVVGSLQGFVYLNCFMIYWQIICKSLTWPIHLPH